jgi:hypothetical protein
MYAVRALPYSSLLKQPTPLLEDGRQTHALSIEKSLYGPSGRAGAKFAKRKKSLSDERLLDVCCCGSIQSFIKTLYAQPAANVNEVEQVFTAYHAHNFAILDHRHLIDIVLS